METMRNQLTADMAEGREPQLPLSEAQLRALAGVKRPQLLEDIADGMDGPADN